MNQLFLKFSAFAAFVFLGFFGFWGNVLAAPFLTFSAFSGHPSVITLNGGGFDAGENVSIYLNNVSGAPAVTVKAGTNSLFGPVSIPLAPDAPQGELKVLAVGQNSGLSAQNIFYVTPFSPVLDVSSAANTPGSIITVSGQGFAPGEIVHLSLGPHYAGTATADQKGNFPKTTIAIPNLPADSYVISAKGAQSGAEAKAYFFIGGFYPSANPSNYFLGPDQTLSFSGYGFAPGETINVSIGQDSAPIASFTASQSGSFENAGKYVIPPGLAGTTQTFRLQGNRTAKELVFDITIGQYDALVNPDNYFVSPGQKVMFYGRGFAPNEQINVFWDQDPAPIAAFRTDKNGGFADAGVWTVPLDSASRVMLFRFIGEHSGVTASTTVTVGKFFPQISPSEYYLTPGKSFTVWGIGFGSNEKVSVTAAGVTSVVTANKDGVFKTSGPFTAPYEQGVMLNIVAEGQQSKARAETAVKMGILSPQIVPAAYYNLPGDSVNVDGYGFAPGEDVMIKSDAGLVIATTTDKYGNFNKYTVDLPFEGGQTTDFLFVGAKSGAVASTTLSTAKLVPMVVLNSYYAHPGASIKVQASGFSRGEPVTFTTERNIFSVNADNQGVTPWTVVSLPLIPAGSTTSITVSGNATKVSGMAILNIAPFTPRVNPSLYYVSPGTELKFYGSDFAPFEDVTVALNGEKVGVISTDIGGGFSSQGVQVPLTAKAARFEFTGALSRAPFVLDIGLAPFIPQVYPSAYFVRPGSRVSLKGLGFAPGETVAIALNGESVTTAIADKTGSFVSDAVALPASLKSAVFTVNGPISGFNTEINISLAKLSPALVLSSYYSPAGSPLTISGYGFASGEKVDVVFGQSPLGIAAADNQGNFVLQTVVPALPAGESAVEGKGESSGASATATFVIPENYVARQAFASP